MLIVEEVSKQPTKYLVFQIQYLLQILWYLEHLECWLRSSLKVHMSVNSFLQFSTTSYLVSWSKQKEIWHLIWNKIKIVQIFSHMMLKSILTLILQKLTLRQLVWFHWDVEVLVYLWTLKRGNKDIYSTLEHILELHFRFMMIF